MNDRAGRGWARLAAIAGLVFLADQATKLLAVKYLTRAFAIAGADGFVSELRTFLTVHDLGQVALGPATVIPAFWSYRYAENHAAAWSLAAGWPDAVRVPFFYVGSLAAIALLAVFYARLHPAQGRARTALALLLGGALGNFADRLVHGYVIDFVDWHLADPDWTTPASHWPTFNVADSAITLGLVLVTLDTLLAWRAMRRESPLATEGRA